VQKNSVENQKLTIEIVNCPQTIPKSITEEWRKLKESRKGIDTKD